MLKWVPNKTINYETVKNLLSECEITGQFSNYGPNVKKLEEYIKHKFQIDDNKSVIVVVNGSHAIQILSHSINVYDNRKLQWATQSFTFPPSNQGTLKTSKIIDIDLDGGIDLEQIDDSIDGFIITNVFGNIVDIDKYIKYCKNNNKYLIFDNAATPFTFYKGSNCLNYGNGCIISFHHTKPFGFGEGGAIIVDKKYEKTVRKLINFGIDLYDNKYYSTEANNCKMSDISASFILQYLYHNFDLIINKHQSLYNYLLKKIDGLSIKLFPSFHDKDKNIVSCFCLLFDANKSIVVQDKLLNNDVYCRKYYYPLKTTINSQRIYDQIICIPCHKDMEYKDIDKIIELIQLI